MKNKLGLSSWFIFHVKTLGTYLKITKIRIFYQILIIIAVMVLFLGIQGYKGIVIIDNMLQSTQEVFDQGSRNIDQLSILISQTELAQQETDQATTLHRRQSTIGVPAEKIAESADGPRGLPSDLLVEGSAAGQVFQDQVVNAQLRRHGSVPKPFHFQELNARLQALLRRSAGWAAPVLACGGISLDTRTQQVKVDDLPIELTSFEYRVLECLMLHAGEVISKTELTERLYDQDFERDSNVIEVFICRLRKKLDPDNSRQPIETLRGRGYRLALPRAAPKPSN